MFTRSKRCMCLIILLYSRRFNGQRGSSILAMISFLNFGQMYSSMYEIMKLDFCWFPGERFDHAVKNVMKSTF